MDQGNDIRPTLHAAHTIDSYKFGNGQAMQRLSSFGQRISTQYTESCHSAAAANQIDSCPRGVGPKQVNGIC